MFPKVIGYLATLEFQMGRGHHNLEVLVMKMKNRSTMNKLEKMKYYLDIK